ncbi:OmpA/MotB family protein [Azospirillum rugosum]|uniref:Chemotaxis protein MotB n=1 Tax=Azospirillum rugosum TaxID=416170 RepID=A0ABS4SJ25_9PROT|nr:flagellar motor protein MotB [Azospirillum rugosum]MBP2292073.1 chemotaxis protein MotB [Azospirillum rugosum]MDQ0525791.1 chemotaxis protein MotB [Azospirillum rugosum]
MIRLPKLPKAEDKSGGHNRTIWLISFTDLMSLLLAFFVLMYSMSEPEAQRWTGLSKSLSSARSTATSPSNAAPEPKAAFNATTVETQSAMNLDYLGALLRTQTGTNEDLASVEVRREDDRVVIGLPGSLMFDASGVTFTDQGRRVLYLLGAAVGRIGNRIEVVGHAEREDQADGRAWERALTRSVAIAAALRETGYKRDLVARGVMAAPVAADGARVDIVVRDEAEG